ncbi:Zinc finger CCCH domain-containing protein 36 [Sesamum alatum]|uniref:Zinc finger CCCH domain-containing protein 36 n=1 Tax=Sesamum alatum TaxID=300844 RepID=A0AAE1XRJ2_9LAMI|nr:Zinc finger CCCH domain-containing protein 36 [Sesamum alatum]
MDRRGSHYFRYTEMSPGLDAWKFGRHFSSSQMGPTHPYRNRRPSPVHRGGEREGFPEDRHNAQVHDLLERVATNDESLRIHRLKAVRSFKFAIAERVKNLIKPYWKEGKISKDAHKVIVKKSVNKVIESFGSSEIPSEGKINSYLISSHSKLSKLVKAYVKKYQKR